MRIRVEVVCAFPQAQTIVEVELGQGARVADALAAFRSRERLAGPSLAGSRIGIWGVPATPDTELRDRDRVEIYRELVADAKQARRRRATQQRVPKMRR
jgi:hypothetical protein